MKLTKVKFWVILSLVVILLSLLDFVYKIILINKEEFLRCPICEKIYKTQTEAERCSGKNLTKYIEENKEEVMLMIEEEFKERK